MVSSCKVCGARTAGNRQYCPHCRARYKGRKDKSLQTIAPYVITGLPFLILFFGYYIFDSGNKNEGSLLILLGGLLLYGMLHSERSRKLFENRIILGCRGEETLKGLNNKSDKKGFWIAILIIIVIFGLLIFLDNSSMGDNNLNKIENLDSNEQIISPEEELINFCTSQFSNEGIFDLKKTDYQDDLASASDWIRNNYENSALTQEQKEHNINYIIENELPKKGYPIVITSGNKREGQVTSQGFYYCNEKGII